MRVRASMAARLRVVGGGEGGGAGERQRGRERGTSPCLRARAEVGGIGREGRRKPLGGDSVLVLVLVCVRVRACKGLHMQERGRE